MRWWYALFIGGYSAFLHVAALVHPKARRWVEGRRQWRSRYAAQFRKTSPVLWVHAASLGEFEQGRPVIEAFRTQFPGWQIVLTFFSPSGYEIRKNYAQADFIAYLPADTAANARDFLALIQPDAAVFVKYEFWANYLSALRQRQTPTLLVSALFRPDQPFFRWYGGFWRGMLACFSHFFVQNEASGQLLAQAGFQNYTVAGDTRVDRVLQLAASAPENTTVAAFATPTGVAQTGHTLIAGSSWEADEAVLLPVLQAPSFAAWRLIVAPHEPAEKHLAQLLARVKRPFVRYSQATLAPSAAAEVLIIDNVGMLNSLYRYGSVAYIGGGFGKGIHNTLEPAAFGLPVIVGPKYEKFEEARQFVARGGAFVVRNTTELAAVLRHLEQPDNYRKASAAVQAYLNENQGATRRIIGYLAAQFA
ncbi:MAG: 3-deoxy-D-manno-octulosonic acid transferase [Saprospiraceae bacterium]|nr:3-deoxy-D-manno-octulosonic acid transferase [Saprospiraceae bacterium]